MAVPRTSIQDFSLANDAYIGATVSFFAPNDDGTPSAVLVTLYADLTGPDTLPNPQVMDSDGKFQQPVYIDQDVVGSVVVGATSHDTGVISFGGKWRGSYVAGATRYMRGDFIVGPVGVAQQGQVYVSQSLWSSTIWATDILDSNKLQLAIDVQAMTSQVVADANYIIKGKVRLAADDEIAGGGAGPLVISAEKFLPWWAVAAAGKQPVFIPANAMTARVTTGSTPATQESATSRLNYFYQDFGFAAASFCQFKFRLPPSVDISLGLSFIAIFTTTAAAGDAIWGFKAVAMSDGDAIDPAAFGAEAQVTKTVAGANQISQTAESGVVTPAGAPIANDLIFVEIARRADLAGDTINAANCRLIGVLMFMTKSKRSED